MSKIYIYLIVIPRYFIHSVIIFTVVEKLLLLKIKWHSDYEKLQHLQINFNVYLLSFSWIGIYKNTNYPTNNVLVFLNKMCDSIYDISYITYYCSIMIKKKNFSNDIFYMRKGTTIMEKGKELQLWNDKITKTLLFCKCKFLHFFWIETWKNSKINKYIYTKIILHKWEI